MRYPGGKGQAGIYQRLISLMPPHDLYIETHVGGGNLFERKRPASSSIVVDADELVCAHWRRLADSDATRSLTVIHGDAAAFLRSFDFAGRRVLIYADPPYVMATRRSGPRYRHEYSDEQHHELLTVLRDVPAMVMLSGYRCPMYDAALARWHRIDYPTLTRGGSWAIESCWLNFDPPARELHDYRYIGADFRERERIKRKRARWRRRFAALPALEREAMLQVLLELASPEVAGRSSSSEMTLPDLSPGMAMGDDVDPTAGPGDAYPGRILSPEPAMITSSSSYPALVDVMPTARLAALAGQSAGEGAR
jgi:hypothetical protein